ncbi:hypothetical protein [Hyphomicrobium sp.]|uniref:hypothetical protein n=1 Tax=Hyphomicrobium sp. TaxID=82 RepID=UPI002D776282|nr:hypothetical protein [Hyphomicrobium sp.]HET6389718.1 hypothetical protein [Hyphomicrobium sp.]
MQATNDPRAPRASYEATETRQATPRKGNFRVLVASMVLAVAVGIVLVAAFWRTTPTAMDYSSGGKLEERAPTPQEAPAAKPETPAAPTDAAPNATPPAPTAPEGQQAPTTP